MIFSDQTIKQYLDSGKILISPSYNEQDIRPTGLRVHLADEILIPKDGQVINFDQPSEIKYEKRSISDSNYILAPNAFILGSTYEKIKVSSDIVCKLDGRSTIARLGIIIHCTSDTIDGNYNEPRSIVFEIKNLGNFNVMLKTQMPFGMLIFNKLTEPILQQSQTQYRNQKSVVSPNIEYKPGIDR